MSQARRYTFETGDLVVYLPDGATPAGDRFEVIEVRGDEIRMRDWGWGDLGADFWDATRWEDRLPKYVVVKTAEQRLAEELMR